MTEGALILALPSKGRLQEQAEPWLADCGFQVERAGDRSYAARLKGAPGVELRLLSAGEIGPALAAGEAHLGVTGEDVLAEAVPDMARVIALLRPLAFGRADLVVAVPQGWIDVAGMDDLADVAVQMRRDTGRLLRVATKYGRLTRQFFTRRGVVDYRIVPSAGATEAAPAAGAADIVVDITTTGSTLAANHLKRLADGVILRSTAQIAASLTASWTEGALAAADALLAVIEARARATTLATLDPPSADGSKSAPLPRAAAAAEAHHRAVQLQTPVGVSYPAFVFSPEVAATARLRDQLSRRYGGPRPDAPSTVQSSP